MEKPKLRHQGANLRVTVDGWMERETERERERERERAHSTEIVSPLT